jgi:hypothetical protein
VNRRIVVLAHGGDVGAAAVVGGAAERIGAGGVLLVQPEALVRASWSHRVAEHGATSTRIRLPDGRTISSAAVGAVLQRVRHLPPPAVRWRDRKDADYAGAEVSALVASWLFSVRRHVLGAAVPATFPWGLAGLVVAHQCGLTVATSVIATVAGLIRAPAHATYQPDPLAALAPVELAAAVDGGHRCVLVIGTAVNGAPTTAIAAACRRLAERLGTSTLAVYLSASAPHAVVALSPYPPLATRWAIDTTVRQLVEMAR